MMLASARRCGRLRGATLPLRLSQRVLSTANIKGVNEVYAEAPSPLQEFSVVYTDRALNHMSEPFKKAMNNISDTLKTVYNAKHVVVIPGSGTYGMEACARQFATGKKSVVIRNGYFSYRWTQIFEACGIPTDHVVLRAKPINEGAPTNQLQWAPHPIEDVIEVIKRGKPGVVFAPHV